MSKLKDTLLSLASQYAVWATQLSSTVQEMVSLSLLEEAGKKKMAAGVELKGVCTFQHE